MENSFHLVDQDQDFFQRKCTLVNGPAIIGAGPSGLAAAACLKEQGVPFVVLERAECIASLWQKRTYDRLKLHLPKQFCQLPKLPFPEDFPEYPTKRQFIEYLESYAKNFDINPKFKERVQSARYDETIGFWRVKTAVTNGSNKTEFEYVCRWLFVATGENAECVVPDIGGLSEFGGEVIHACEYKSGEKFQGQKVLVVGCGNSGMEVYLDLCNHNASPSMVVRSSKDMSTSSFQLVKSVEETIKVLAKVLKVATWLSWVSQKGKIVSMGKKMKENRGWFKVCLMLFLVFTSGPRGVRSEDIGNPLIPGSTAMNSLLANKNLRGLKLGERHQMVGTEAAAMNDNTINYHDFPRGNSPPNNPARKQANPYQRSCNPGNHCRQGKKGKKS